MTHKSKRNLVIAIALLVPLMASIQLGRRWMAVCQIESAATHSEEFQVSTTGGSPPVEFVARLRLALGFSEIQGVVFAGNSARMVGTARAVRLLGGPREITFRSTACDRISDVMEAMGRCDKVESFQVFGCPKISDDVFERMDRNYTSIKNLVLQFTSVSGEGVTALHTLISLDLSGSPVSDSGLEEILALPRLTELVLDHPAISRNAMSLIAQMGGHVKTILIGNMDEVDVEFIRGVAIARTQKFPGTVMDVP